MLRIVFFTLALIFPAAAAMAQTGYRLQPGDTVAIEVTEDSSLNRQALVLPDGSISFPMVGAVKASGRTTTDLGSALSSGLASNFASQPSVTVSVVGLAPVREAKEREPETINIYLMGEVATPGPKAILPGSTVLQALSQAGGFSKFAATKRLQLRRIDPQSGAEAVYPINYKALSQGATLKGNFVLREGDVILVPERRLFE